MQFVSSFEELEDIWSRERNPIFTAEVPHSHICNVTWRTAYLHCLGWQLPSSHASACYRWCLGCLEPTRASSISILEGMSWDAWRNSQGSWYLSIAVPAWISISPNGRSRSKDSCILVASTCHFPCEQFPGKHPLRDSSCREWTRQSCESRQGGMSNAVGERE